MRESKELDQMREARHQRSSLRVRLTILVCLDLILSILLTLGILYLIHWVFPQFDVPAILELLVISIIVSTIITTFMSRWFFDPIRVLRGAMERVASGDFKVRLDASSATSEIKEIYAGFNLMVKELDATEILQSDFVSNVSHEFKTPISAIEGYATLLQDCDNLNEEQKTYVEKINFNTARLSSLVGNILLLSRIDNQHIPTNLTTFRLDEQIRQSIVMLEPQWDKKEIELDVELDRVEFLGNGPLLYHVWDNLIGNAIKFSPYGGLVKVGLTQSGDTVLFTVEDEGPGIPPEALSHIFDKFFQADSSRKAEGNGLGLALVNRIITMAGGSITAENKPDCGCRFLVHLQNHAV